jgi:DNA polymerase elongation subunit (family B)
MDLDDLVEAAPAPALDNEQPDGYEKLLSNVDALEIHAAAGGLRPVITDGDPLPLVDGKLRMAPASATYKVTRTGEGTEVTLFGTTPEGHSCSVRINGFYPYMYMRIGVDMNPMKLIHELDSTLLLMVAFEGEKRRWSSEYQSIAAGLIGSVRKYGTQHILAPPRAFDTRRCRPIVGWEVVEGSLLRGSGEMRGYRGLEAQRFLKIYFYAPAFVAKAKQILHGAHNENGAVAQAMKLATGRTSMQDRLAADAAATAAEAAIVADAKAEKKRGKEFGRLRYMTDVIKQWVPHGDTGEGDGVESSDDENGDDVDDVVANVDEDEEADDLVVPLMAAAFDEKMAIRPEQVATGRYEDELAEESMLAKCERDMEEQETALLRDRGARAFDRFYGLRHNTEIAHDSDTKEGHARLEVRVNEMLQEKARMELSEYRSVLDKSGYLNQADRYRNYVVCEADIDFVLRLAIDAGFSYNQFIEIDMRTTLEGSNCHTKRRWESGSSIKNCEWSPPGTPPGVAPTVRTAERACGDGVKRTTSSQIEVFCDFHHIRLSPDAALQAKVPHKVVVSLDCEMATNGTFPKPETHAVLQIGIVVPLPNGRRREIGFTTGRLVRGPGEFVDDFPTGLHKRRHDETDDPEVIAALSKKRFKRVLDAGVESEHILCFPSESMMLLALANFIKKSSPDVILSFNGDNFDMPYLIARADILNIKDDFRDAWGVLLADRRIKCVDRTFGTTAIGKHEYKEVSASGRLFYDLFQYWKRNPMLKERSYSLNALSKKYLNMEKENVAYSQIDNLQKTPEGRRKLLTYCIRDSLLPVLLDQKRTISYELLEKSRGTGVPVEMLLKRGMQIQCKTYLYRKSRIGILIPEMAAGMPNIYDAGQRRPAFWYTRTDEERRVEMRGPKFDGATVIEPDRGLHEEPVVTLDFRALYPSIMISGNYCLSTLVAPNFRVRDDGYFKHLVASGQRTWAELLMSVGTVIYDPKEPGDVFDEKIDAGSVQFIRHDVLRGFVPDIERELLVWRDSVKAELKKAKKTFEDAKVALAALEKREETASADELRAAQALVAETLVMVYVLDGRQNSIKLIANSLYGVFGAKTSFAFCLDLADSVTRRGRACILYARHLTRTVINDITPDHPQARLVAAFPGLRTKLTSLDKGSEVVEKLCAEIAAARKTKPLVKKLASATAATGNLRAMFSMIAARQKNGAPAAPTALQQDVIDDSVKIRDVYGDTDSLFFGFWLGLDMNSVGRIAILMAQFISISLHLRWPTRNPDDNVYQFDVEKAFRVLILFAKKRYAGLKELWNEKTQSFSPADPKNPFKPSDSGLETRRRDTTRLVSECMTQVLSILVDYRYPREEKLRRANTYIYFSMVEPLKKGTVQKRLIVQTRQMRKLPEEYLATNGGRETSLPVQVQMALRIKREKGEAEAPKSGDRVAFLVVRGNKGDKSSSRGVDPLEVLETDRQIDAQYYLEKHVAPAICRVMEPIIVANATDIPGLTEKAQLNERMAITHQAVFGSREDYYKPSYADSYRVAIAAYEETNEFARKDAQGLVRYHRRSQVVERGVSDDLAQLAVAGAKCQCCRQFFVGEVRGYVCEPCVTQNRDDARNKAHLHLATRRADLEELASERASIYEHCQRCAHTERCPTSIITCDESQCDTFWERKENEKALNEADRLVATASRVLAAEYDEYF